MITQKQIKQWIPIAESIFQKYMPVTTALPPIYIGSPKKIVSLRADLVEKTKPRHVGPPEPYDFIMEMIHGDCGDAILIQQKLVYEGPGADALFCRSLWHELGHFFVFRYEYDELDEHGTSALYRYNDLEFTEESQYTSEQIKQEGYWFWSEFIAEAIANYVDEQYCQNDNTDYYHPERITWEPDQWGSCPELLLDFLEMALSYYPDSIDTDALAMYFASLLTKVTIKRYVQAAEEGKLKVYDELNGSKLMKPGSIDATCITDMPGCFQDTLWAIKALLEEQLEKKEFWKIDEDFLEEIGECILRLMLERIEWLSANPED